MSTLHFFAITILISAVFVHPATAIEPMAEERVSSSVYEADDVVVGASRIPLKQQSSQTIKIDETGGARPSLEGALQGQANIQIIPTPLGGADLILNGMSGERVGIYWDGDPVLGRVDGALDARTVSLGSVNRVSVYQGFDSLPYGNQNIGGVVSLESPWEMDRQVRLKSAGGNYGRSIFDGKAVGVSPGRDASVLASASSWRTQAIRVDDGSVDTNFNSSARFSAAALGTKLSATELGGVPVDVRLGGSGSNEDTRGVLSESLTEGQQRRMHVFSDVRRGDSVFHLSFSDYRNHYKGLAGDGSADRDDIFEERAVRVGPQIQESVGRLTVLAGSVADIHSTTSTRISAGQVNTASVGTYAGARYALSSHWIAGAGTRWDTGPGLVSPRAELRYLFSSDASGKVSADHFLTLESGLGFREASPKEQYMLFTNPALHYTIVGNPDLLTERAWLTALRYKVTSGRATFTSSVFETQVRNAIGFIPVSGKPGLLTYSNISRTRTQGAQLGSDIRLSDGWLASANYQYLHGRNLDKESELFLQPPHRLAFSLSRSEARGFSLLGQAVWTSRQAYFDVNQNGVVDAAEWIGSYWMTSVEPSYGFRWQGVSDLVKLFARVDNVFNNVHEQLLVIEPRTFLMGAMVEL
jgi:outer membrane receptor protein involved in Fe transport